MNVTKAALAVAVLGSVSCGDGSQTHSDRPDPEITTVDREYRNSVKEAHEAALAILKGEHLRLDKDLGDDLGSETVASRATEPENKVFVYVQALDGTTCRVSIRAEPGNREQANALQMKFAEKLAPAGR